LCGSSDYFKTAPSIRSDISLEQGLPFCAVWLVFDIARQLGITEALGSSMEGKLALWQIIARVIYQGSRLSATRLAREHAACDILGLIQLALLSLSVEFTPGLR